MITGSSMVGSADVGLIVCTPLLGMLKLIVSRTPTLALEQLIASRSEPVPLSLVLMTTRLHAACTVTALENSEVSMGNSSTSSRVAVAVKNVPVGVAVAKLMVAIPFVPVV